MFGETSPYDRWFPEPQQPKKPWEQYWEKWKAATDIAPEQIILAPGFISLMAIVGFGMIYFWVRR